MTPERHPSAPDVKLDNIRIQLTAIEDLLTDIRNELINIGVVRPSEMAESVSCDHCDAGADSIAEAMKAGWADITFDPGGLSWNFLGTCPGCVKAEDEEIEARTVKREEPKQPGTLF